MQGAVVMTTASEAGGQTFRAATQSISGRQRDHNEDAVLDAAGLKLWAVADGMGGHHAGDVASRMIVERLGQLDHDDDLVAMCEKIEATLVGVNRELQDRSDGDESRLMGSTVVFLLVRNGLMLCGWAGDSRVYSLRNGVLLRLSRDHSHVEEMVGRGEITAAEARTHPDANIVTRAIGGEPRLVLEYSLSVPQDGDRFFLCSDGIDKELDDGQLQALLKGEPDTASCCERIVAAADLAGGRDNISGVLVDVEGNPPQTLGGLPGAQRALAALCDDYDRQRINFENFRIRRSRLILELLDPDSANPAAMMETMQIGGRPATRAKPAGPSTGDEHSDRTPPQIRVEPLPKPARRMPRWWWAAPLLVLAAAAWILV